MKNFDGTNRHCLPKNASQSNAWPGAPEADRPLPPQPRRGSRRGRGVGRPSTAVMAGMGADCNKARLKCPRTSRRCSLETLIEPHFCFDFIREIQLQGILCSCFYF